VKRALVVQTAYLGDVILSQPLWAAVKRAWPACEVDVLVQPQWAPLIERDPDLHEVLRFDKHGAARGLRGLRRMANRLRARQYDLALCPHPSFRSALLLRLAGIPLRVGFDDSAGAVFFTNVTPRDRAQHEVDRVLSLLAAVGVRPPDAIRAPRLFVDQPNADETLAKWGIEPGARFVCAHPGSVWATKRWTPEGFAAVLSDLADDGYQPVVLGGADDVAEANQVQDRCRTLPLNLAGRLSLAELALLLSRAALLVTNDSGPMHVAGAVGAPLVAVFGSTTPALGYGPVGSPSRVVEHPLPCRPCGPHGRRRCPLDHFDCMKKIKAEEVVAACREALTGDAAT
jgi:heptosyltransferase-2